MLKVLSQNKYLILIISIGLALRLYGIGHGFPYIYNVDEPALVRSASQIRFDINPKHFDWPHMHFYLNYLLFTAFSAARSVIQMAGLKSSLIASFPLLWRDPLIFYYLARAFNAFLGTGTILVMYFIGSKLMGRKAGVVSALAMALFPYHVWASHFALIDVPMTFWFSLSVLFSINIYKEGRWKDYILAGLFAGFSASTKYNGGFAVLIIFLAYLLRIQSENVLSFDFAKVLSNKNTKAILVAAVFSVIGFFAGTPFALFDYKTFSITDSPKGAYWQFTNVGKVNAGEYFEQLLQVLTTRFADEFGVTYLVIFELYILFVAIAKREKSRLLVLIPGIFYFLYVTSFDKNRIHYYMLTFPFIALMVADVFVYLEELLIIRFSHKKYMIALVCSAIFFAPLVISLQKAFFISQPDTRNIVSEWVRANVPAGATIYYSGGDLEAVVADLNFKTKKAGSLSNLNIMSGSYVLVSTNQTILENQALKNLSLKSDVVFLNEPFGSRPGPNIYVLAIK